MSTIMITCKELLFIHSLLLEIEKTEKKDTISLETKFNLAIIYEQTAEYFTKFQELLHKLSIIKDYDNERLDLLKKYAKSDPNGNPMIKNYNYVINPDHEKTFKEKYKELKKRRSGSITIYKQIRAEIDEFLKEVITLKIPDITCNDINGLFVNTNPTFEELAAFNKLLVTE